MKIIAIALFCLATGAQAATHQTPVDGLAARDLYDAALSAGGKALHDLGEDGHAELGGSACQRVFTRLTSYACNLRAAPGSAVLAIDGGVDSAAGQLFEALSAAAAQADDLDLGVRQRIRLTHLDCVAFAVSGGYHCVVSQTVPDAEPRGVYSVFLRSRGSDMHGTYHYDAAISVDGAVVYQGIACSGATSLTATCSTRQVSVEANADAASSLFLALPSGAQVAVGLACVPIKAGLACGSAGY